MPSTHGRQLRSPAWDLYREMVLHGITEDLKDKSAKLAEILKRADG